MIEHGVFLSASAIGLCAALSKRSPARVMISWLLHLRAAWMWAGVAAAAVARVAPRYRECLEAVRRDG